VQNFFISFLISAFVLLALNLPKYEMTLTVVEGAKQ